MDNLDEVFSRIVHFGVIINVHFAVQVTSLSPELVIPVCDAVVHSWQV